jgi:hypothetical protein
MARVDPAPGRMSRTAPTAALGASFASRRGPCWGAAAGAHHARAERWHWHVIGPRIGADQATARRLVRSCRGSVVGVDRGRVLMPAAYRVGGAVGNLVPGRSAPWPVAARKRMLTAPKRGAGAA